MEISLTVCVVDDVLEIGSNTRLCRIHTARIDDDDASFLLWLPLSDNTVPFVHIYEI